jgi:hypothetical protein
MEFTKEDIAKLLGFGHRKSELKQLQEAAIVCKYTDEDDRRISATKVLEMIGRDQWLSGISRAAFHFTCGRGEHGKNYVHFDCNDLFR